MSHLAVAAGRGGNALDRQRRRMARPARLRDAADCARSSHRYGALGREPSRGLPTVAHAHVGKRKRRLARPAGLEPATLGLEGPSSEALKDRPIFADCAKPIGYIKAVMFSYSPVRA